MAQHVGPIVVCERVPMSGPASRQEWAASAGDRWCALTRSSPAEGPSNPWGATGVAGAARLTTVETLS